MMKSPRKINNNNSESIKSPRKVESPTLKNIYLELALNNDKEILNYDQEQKDNNKTFAMQPKEHCLKTLTLPR